MAEYKWPPSEKRALIGKRVPRLDGPAKSSGRAKYTFDMNRPGMLHAKLAFSPHAHAKVAAIDTSIAEKMPGVKAVQIIFPVGTEVFWAGQELVAVAAETEEQARDAARAVRIQYDVLPHFVSDVPPERAGINVVKTGEVKEGDPDRAFAEADAVHEGYYGNTQVAHCCLEPHGQVTEWQGDNLTVWATTQNVSGIGGEFAKSLTAKGVPVDVANVEIICQMMGGGFGSKFAADPWGVACAQLAKTTGRPVKLMLERDQELMEAGSRPSLYARVKIAAKKDGTLTGWQSDAWGTSGPQAQSPLNLPYLFNFPNRSANFTAVLTNTGPIRAWRAPNAPQQCYMTMCPFDDLAAKLQMDPVEMYRKNLPILGARAKDYEAEITKASELMDWKSKWHPRGDTGTGPIKRGVGVSLHTWGGGGRSSTCQVKINPDGSVEVSLASQDLGTGNRTVIGIVAADTLGLPLEMVHVNIGDSRFPPSGSSGGSTTVGSVSSSTRVTATDALNQLFAKVAPVLGVSAERLEAMDSRIQVIDDASKGLDWKQACAKLGGTSILATNQMSRDIISQGVGGVQMAEVNVDIETGVIRVDKLVAVQDCGLIINMTTAESQVYGALIFGVNYSLYEEKIMDQQTGRHLNPNMEFYKLAGMHDIGELVVHMMTGPSYDERGPIGLGEPPTVSPGAALSNAVANAIGVRVPELPMTPDRVLAALGKA
jgi:xanthine dehydrogenase YagR molybdenum-binding subunit